MEIIRNQIEYGIWLEKHGLSDMVNVMILMSDGPAYPRFAFDLHRRGKDEIRAIVFRASSIINKLTDQEVFAQKPSLVKIVTRAGFDRVTNFLMRQV